MDTATRTPVTVLLDVGGALDDLQAAIRREIGTDKIDLRSQKPNADAGGS